QKTLVALFQSMGIGEVRNHMSAVESDVVERVKRHLERQKTPEVVEERVRSDGRVVKRQRRAAEGEPGIPAPRPSSPDSMSGRALPSPSPSQAGSRAPSIAEASGAPSGLRAEHVTFPDAPPSAPSRKRVPAATPSAPAQKAPPPEPSARG